MKKEVSNTCVCETMAKFQRLPILRFRSECNHVWIEDSKTDKYIQYVCKNCGLLKMVRID